MRLTATLLLSILAFAALVACGGKNNTALYPTSKPYTRWWWFSSEIDDNDVRQQLIWLRDHEFGGVEIAWIYPMGLDSTTSHPAFLSPEWAQHVNYAKHVADSLGLGCDFTYGTLWPFSDVDLPAGHQTRTYFDTVNPARRSYTWDYPREARILNHLDRNAFHHYAAKMNQGLKNAYKGTKSGLFVDSWEVETEYLWTPGFAERFMSEHSYDITPYIEQHTLLDKENAEVFYDYMSTLSNYVLHNFYQPFAANARSVGAFSRAQCGGAPTDLLDAFALVDVPETEAILYQPSFSKIAASAATLSGKPVVSAEAFTCAYGWTSLRHQNGRGHSPYQGKEQIADLKLICDALFANGTNQIIWHGFPFNRVGDTSNFFYTTCQISTSPLNNLTGEALTHFNRYMTQVSHYMRRGRNYSDIAVYLPTEDAWMGGAYPDSLRKVKAFFWGQYEMRFINTPAALKGYQPMWVNQSFLHHYLHSLQTGQNQHMPHFKGLYVDVEYMDYHALLQVLHLAQAGLPVCLVRNPKQPGRAKHHRYAEVVRQIRALPNVADTISIFNAQPLIAGADLPDFWVREVLPAGRQVMPAGRQVMPAGRQEGGTYYIFFANPITQTISYPLPYGYAFSDRGSVRTITVNHHGTSQPYTLRFEPMQSLLLKIDKRGIKQIHLNYTPHKI